MLYQSIYFYKVSCLRLDIYNYNKKNGHTDVHCIFPGISYTHSLTKYITRAICNIIFSTSVIFSFATVANVTPTQTIHNDIALATLDSSHDCDITCRQCTFGFRMNS